MSAAGEDRQAAGNGEEAVPTAGQRLQAIQQRIKQQHAAASAVGDASYSLSATQVLPIHCADAQESPWLLMHGLSGDRF